MGGSQRYHLASATVVRATTGSVGAVDDRSDGSATTIVEARAVPHGQSGHPPGGNSSQSGRALSSGAVVWHRAAVACRTERSGLASRPGNRERNHSRLARQLPPMLAAAGSPMTLLRGVAVPRMGAQPGYFGNSLHDSTSEPQNSTHLAWLMAPCPTILTSKKSTTASISRCVK